MSSSHEAAGREAAIAANAGRAGGRAMKAGKLPSPCSRGDRKSDRFGSKRKIPVTRPPRSSDEAAFPAFTASAPKALHSTSVISER